MGPTSFTGIVYETSIEMGYFIGAHPSCELRHLAGLGPLRTRQQPPIQASLLIPLTHLGRPIPPIHRIPVPLCESNDDCAPGICGEDGTCQPRDLACFSDADCFDDEYCAFPSGSSYDPALAGACTPACTGPEECPLGKNVSMVGALAITIATPLPTAATAPQMKCATVKPDL